MILLLIGFLFAQSLPKTPVNVQNWPSFYDITPASPSATDYSVCRLTNGTAFYEAGGGGGPSSTVAISQTSTENDVDCAVSNFPPSQAVTGTFWQTTQPVSIAFMPSTAVTGTFWQATQPVSGTFWQATQPVSGTFWQATQPVSIAGTVATSLATLPQAANMSAASSTTTNVVSLGNSLGKTNANKTGALVTTAVTADQVVLTYTVTSGKTFYLLGWNITARLTTFAATATNFGLCSLESAAGTKHNTTMVANAGTPQLVTTFDFPEPMPIAASTVVRIVCTPSATTSFTWQANMMGYEK